MSLGMVFALPSRANVIGWILYGELSGQNYLYTNHIKLEAYVSTLSSILPSISLPFFLQNLYKR